MFPLDGYLLRFYHVPGPLPAYELPERAMPTPDENTYSRRWLVVSHCHLETDQ